MMKMNRAINYRVDIEDYGLLYRSVNVPPEADFTDICEYIKEDWDNQCELTIEWGAKND